MEIQETSINEKVLYQLKVGLVMIFHSLFLIIENFCSYIELEWKKIVGTVSSFGHASLIE